jgi:hypothetical protein
VLILDDGHKAETVKDIKNSGFLLWYISCQNMGKYCQILN